MASPALSPDLLDPQLLDHVVKLRQELHRIPELGYQEHQTAAVIRRELTRLGIEFASGPENASTATIATIGDRSKPCILLRADIDALPIREQTGLPYASRHDGVMHACGHDGHTANLLGVANELLRIQDELPVCVKLVWQPAEEGGGGARRLVQAGLLERTERFGPEVVAAFGLHGWPMLPLGCVSTKPGPLLAATDTFEMQIVGKGGHAAFPHLTRDPIIAACTVVTALQQFVSREMDPTEPAVLSITRIHAGTANNVIPDRCVVGGTCRTLNAPSRKLAREALERRARATAEAGECQLEFTWTDGYPPTTNDPHMSDFVATVARDLVGPDRYLPAARPAMGGEDFAYYLEKVPGCFFLVGLMPPGRMDHPALHTPRFDFTDGAMTIGIRMMTELCRRFVV